MRYLTKSRFRLGIDCPAKLYYTKKEKLYANTKDLDTFMQALASGGFQVEELARLHYPGGTLIEDDRTSKNYYSNALDSTIRALSKSDDIVIYELKSQSISVFYILVLLYFNYTVCIFRIFGRNKFIF